MPKGDTKELANAKTGQASLQAKNAAQYVLATQRACSLKDWEKIITKAKEDAFDDNARIRDSARRFLSRMIMPADPSSASRVFNPTQSVDQLQEHMRKLDGMRAEMLRMSAELLEYKKRELEEAREIKPEYTVE